MRYFVEGYEVRSENAAKLNRLAALLAECVEDAARVENSRATAGRISARIKEIGTRPGGELVSGSPLLNTTLPLWI